MQTTDLTPRCLGLEVCLHGPSPLEERGGLKRGLHSNCWGEVRRTATHIVALLEITYPCQPIKGEEDIRRFRSELLYARDHLGANSGAVGQTAKSANLAVSPKLQRPCMVAS